MATFDLQTFLKLKGGDQRSAIDALGMQYGMPSCMLNLTKDALRLLPSNVVGQIALLSSEASNKADELTKAVFRRLMLNTGIIEFDTDSGTFRFLSDTSRFKMESDGLGFLDNIGGLFGIFEYATSFGAEIYRNYDNTLRNRS